MKPSFLKLIENESEFLLDSTKANSYFVPEHGEVISSPLEISNLFALCTSLKVNAKTFLQKKEPHSFRTEIQLLPFGNTTEFDCIHFEAIPSLNETEKPFFLRKGEIVSFFIEIFQTSYQFEGTVIETEMKDQAKNHFAISPPSSIEIKRLRRYPRKAMQDQAVKVCLNGEEVKLIEIGPDSMMVEKNFYHSEHSKPIYLKTPFSDKEITLNLVRNRAECSVLKLNSHEEQETYFKFYLSLLYPVLKESYQVQLFDLPFIFSKNDSKKTYISRWETLEPTLKLLIEIESLLIKKDTEFDLICLYSTENKEATQLWNKFSQNSIRHRFIFSSHLSELWNHFDKKEFRTDEIENKHLRFIRLKYPELLLLYSSIQHTIVLNEERKKIRKKA